MAGEIQKFSVNDVTEDQITGLIKPSLDEMGDDLDDFFEGADTCFLLGDVIYDSGRTPLQGVITRSIFRSSFFAIHELFTRPGTFEFYLEVFRAVFGEDVQVEFVIPNPGHLQINIAVLNNTTFRILARRIVDNQYEYYPLVTQDDDYIIGEGTQGIKSQSEIDSLISEISMAGIYTECNLTT